jgi:hypothetical protein
VERMGRDSIKQFSWKTFRKSLYHKWCRTIIVLGGLITADATGRSTALGVTSPALVQNSKVTGDNMARARSLKPGFHKNADLIALPPLTRILFAGLWTIADREGRLEDRPKQIKIEVLPGDSCNVERMLAQLHDAGFITRYEVGGRNYIAIPTWKKHQNPHKDERPSIIPAPCEHSASTLQAPCKDSSNPADSLNLTPDSLIPDSLSSDCFNQSPVTVNPEPVTPTADSSLRAVDALCAVAAQSENALFEEFIGVFLAAGVKLSGRDVQMAGMGTVHRPGFLGFDLAEQQQILAYVIEKAQHTEARYMGLPANFLDKREWERKGIERALPNPTRTKVERAQEEAARMFMEGK